MKRIGNLILLLTIAVFPFACNEKEIPTIPVDAISINQTSLELEVGQTQKLISTVNPSNASNRNIYWTSSDQSVATVDNTGKVTALKAGSATITVTTEDGGKTATCKVTVNAKIYPVTGVTIDKISVELTEGDVTVLTATVNPSNASNKNVYWTSSAQSVATVDNAGKVTAVKAGASTITVTTEDGGKTATCSVTVKEKLYPVTGVTLDKTSVELTEGDVTVLTATVNPSNASNRNVYWTSSDQSVATVDNTGKVSALKAGSATITVTTEDGGKTATCSVTVKEKLYPVTGVTLDKTSVELTEGDVTVLTATVNPSNASNKNVYWTSSDQTVATVDNTGKVTSVKAGSATITVTTEDGGKTATCMVTVKEKIYPVTGVTLDRTSVELTEGDVTVLTATVNPSNASNKNVFWTSSDQSVASVDNTGKVSALKAGSATITVTTEDGGKTATCSVTVKEKLYPVIGVSLDRTSVELTEGDVTVLHATVNPSNASNRNVYWTSSDTSVATVDNAGKVTAVKRGTALITVTTEDGNKTATCTITVTKPSHGVDIGDWEGDGSDDGGIAS